MNVAEFSLNISILIPGSSSVLSYIAFIFPSCRYTVFPPSFPLFLPSARLCVGFYVLDKTATSPRLEVVASHRRGNLSFNPAPALGCLSNLCDCPSSPYWLPVVEGVPRPVKCPKGEDHSQHLDSGWLEASPPQAAAFKEYRHIQSCGTARVSTPWPPEPGDQGASPGRQLCIKAPLRETSRSATCGGRAGRWCPPAGGGRGGAQRLGPPVSMRKAPQQASKWCQIRCLPLRPRLQDKQMSLPHTKPRGPQQHFHIGPWGRWVLAWHFWRLVVSWSEPGWFSKLGVLRASLSGAGIKSWGCPMWGSSPLFLREKLSILNYLPTVGHGRCALWQDCVLASPAPSVRAFSRLPHMEELLSQFLLFSEEVLPYRPVGWMCLWEEVSSGSCVAILNWNPPSLLSFLSSFQKEFEVVCK